MKHHLAAYLFTTLAAFAAPADSVQKLAAVGKEGAGNEVAAAAWKEAVAAGPSAIPALLAATGKGSAVADNWLRLAADAILDAALRSKAAVPLDEATKFLKNTANASGGRVLAFDVIRRADPALAAQIEPGLASDPVQELRRGAVALLISDAKKIAGGDAKPAWKKALAAVRDEDQTKVVAEALKTLGEPVDLPRHFGFVTRWHVIGPFDNTDRAGFGVAFGPEKNAALDAVHDGKSGSVKWRPLETAGDYGKLDFNTPYGRLKETTAYALATFNAAEERAAQVRLGCKNGWKVWLNGQLLFARDEYHRGQQMDQYILDCRLRKGANQILVKCCQDGQKEEWTVEWEFQLRVCDSTGTAIQSE